MGGLDCLGSILTFYKQIFFADRQYVTPNFDTKQAGTRISKIRFYRAGNFDAHTMTPRGGRTEDFSRG